MNDTERDELHANLCAAIDTEAYKHTGERIGLVNVMIDTVKPLTDRLTAERDAGYHDRAQILALLASTHGVRAVVTPAVDIDEPGWLLLYIDTWAGQLSWHIAPSDARLFWQVEHVRAGDPRAVWDGHTTEEKHRRMSRITGVDKLMP